MIFVSASAHEAGERASICTRTCASSWKGYVGVVVVMMHSDRRHNPGIPCMALRGFGDVSLGTRVADHKKRTDQRDAKHRAFMEEARDRPEDFSPVVPYKEVGDWMVGRKIEVR